jgi:hypothetical protein
MTGFRLPNGLACPTPPRTEQTSVEPRFIVPTSSPLAPLTKAFRHGCRTLRACFVGLPTLHCVYRLNERSIATDEYRQRVRLDRQAVHARGRIEDDEVTNGIRIRAFVEHNPCVYFGRRRWATSIFEASKPGWQDSMFGKSFERDPMRIVERRRTSNLAIEVTFECSCIHISCGQRGF